MNRDQYDYFLALVDARQRLRIGLRVLLIDWPSKATTARGRRELRATVQELHTVTAMHPDDLIGWWKFRHRDPETIEDTEMTDTDPAES